MATLWLSIKHKEISPLGKKYYRWVSVEKNCINPSHLPPSLNFVQLLQALRMKFHYDTKKMLSSAATFNMFFLLQTIHEKGNLHFLFRGCSSYIFNFWRWMNFAVVAINDIQVMPGNTSNVENIFSINIRFN